MGRVRLGGWQSPAAMPLRRLAAIFAICAIFAGLVAIFSADYVHRLWGTIAACGYGLALVALLGRRNRAPDLALGLSFAGALAVPLAWMAIRRVAHLPRHPVHGRRRADGHPGPERLQPVPADHGAVRGAAGGARPQCADRPADLVRR